MKICVIDDWNDSDRFEQKVNNWIEKNSHLNIVDIKYSISVTGDAYGTYGTTYSAMVLFRE